MKELRHDVKNILYAVRSLAELHLFQTSQHRFEDPNDQLRHAEETLRKVYQQSDRGLAVMKRIATALSETKISKANYGLSYRTSLWKVWQNVKEFLQKKYPFSAVEWIERIPGGFPDLSVPADKFRDILYCLAENGLQAMTGGGKMILRAQIGLCPSQNPAAIITLSDTGPGIQEETLPCVFDPFFTTKHPGQGSGLGLYLVQRMVAGCHGRIMVSSFKNSGATFTLEFPVSPVSKKK